MTYSLLQSTEGPPTTPQIFAYAIGAVMSFTILGGLSSGGFRRPMPQHATQTMTLGTSLNVLSVTGAMAGSWVFAKVTQGLVAWAGAALIGGLVYLLLESVERRSRSGSWSPPVTKTRKPQRTRTRDRLEGGRQEPHGVPWPPQTERLM